MLASDKAIMLSKNLMITQRRNFYFSWSGKQDFERFWSLCENVDCSYTFSYFNGLDTDEFVEKNHKKSTERARIFKYDPNTSEDVPNIFNDLTNFSRWDRGVLPS